MVEECKNRLPSLLTPDEIVIGNWISSRVTRQQQGNDSPSDTKAAKTPFMKRQEQAAVLSNPNLALCKQNTEIAEQTLEHHYKGVVLEIPVETDDDSDDDTSATDSDAESDVKNNQNEIRIVTSVFWQGTEDKGSWHVTTDLACELEACMHSEQKYSSSGLEQLRSFKIARGSAKKPGLGTYIKLFNENEKGCWALG